MRLSTSPASGRLAQLSGEGVAIWLAAGPVAGAALTSGPDKPARVLHALDLSTGSVATVGTERTGGTATTHYRAMSR
ncbi:MAG TPA: hypothetical protein VG253_18295 [Streptosporangiaceae bacterium]|nr:hypothetical protein [Streptosporangiaceae bacterium]